MSQRVEARVQPALLVWARLAAGLTVETVARKVGASEERVASWESGDQRPTINQLRTLGRIYRRPIAVFYLSEPPEQITIPTDFRRLPGEVSGTASPDLRYEIRQAVRRREIALDLIAEAGDEPRELEIAMPAAADADEVARGMRAALGVTPDKQRTWRGPYDSFNALRAAIESAGGLVLQMTEVPLDEARGFSLADSPLPVVVVNIKDSPRGRAFSLLHELTHVALRQGGLCDLDESSARDPEALRIEQFCNAVAGAALIPGDELLAEPVVVTHGLNSEWSDHELTLLASRFGASREAVLRRLLTLGLTTSAHYSEQREAYIQEYEEAQRQRAEGFAPPAQMAVAGAGPTFTGLVLGGYADGTLTAGDVSDFLGVRLKHLPRIERLLGLRSDA